MERLITDGIRTAAAGVDGIRHVETRLVWDPAWNSGMIAPNAW
jgi:metal-sulfur cluster biosynthetic enzyme